MRFAHAPLAPTLLVSLAFTCACSVDAGLDVDPALDARLKKAPALAHRDALSLVALDRELGPANSDVRPARAMALRDERTRELRAPPAPVWTGALLDANDAGAAAWVTIAGDLILQRDGAADVVIDHDVIPELDARGSLLAYAKSVTAAQPGVYVVDIAKLDAARPAAPRLISRGLAFADRPLFVDDANVVVAGAVPSGITGIWLAHVDGAAPTPLTNAKLRTGRPLGPTFVPPPATHESMHVEDGALVYFDGAREQRVVLR